MQASRDEVLRQTLELISQVSSRPVVATGRSHIVGDLAFDSIVVLQLVAAIEDHYDINVPLQSIEGVELVDDIVDRVLELTARA